MILLNIGCGEVQPREPWINVDRDPHTANRGGHHVCMDIASGPWHWEDNSVDGIAASHIFEHLDAHLLQKVLEQCYRVLKPGGVLRCTVPDASYFRQVFAKDSPANAEELFGEPIRHPDYQTFTGWALFLYDDHRQVFTEDSLWMSLVNREYPPTKTQSWLPENVVRAPYQKSTRPGHYCAEMLASIDNRPHFSLHMEAFK